MAITEVGMNRPLARTISTECDSRFGNRLLVDISSEAEMAMLASTALETPDRLTLSASMSHWRRPRICLFCLCWHFPEV